LSKKLILRRQKVIRFFLFQFGCDYSHGLLTICRSRGFEVARSDCLALPFKSEIADGVICIAVIHHLSTQVGNIIVWSEFGHFDHVHKMYLPQLI
jgi:Methyltransferase domain